MNISKPCLIVVVFVKDLTGFNVSCIYANNKLGSGGLGRRRMSTESIRNKNFHLLAINLISKYCQK